MPIGRHIWKLAGYAPDLPTPFSENDAIDAAAFEHFCGLQILNGATALVVGGTTGEAPNLSREEHCKLVRIATGVFLCDCIVAKRGFANLGELWLHLEQINDN